MANPRNDESIYMDVEREADHEYFSQVQRPVREVMRDEAGRQDGGS